MSIYRFGENSLIDEVTFHHTGGGGSRAYLHASENANVDALKRLKNALDVRGLQSTPMQENGEAVLEVRAFGKQEYKLLNVLSANNATQGSPNLTTAADDKISWGESLRRNTLPLSGGLYFAGDLGFLTYASKEAFAIKNGKRTLANPQLMASAVAYALGSPFLVFFGRGDKSNLQLKYMSYNLIHDLEKQGVEVPKDASVRTVANGHDATTLKKAHSFFQRYPAEIANSFFAAAGSLLVWDHVKTFDMDGFKKARAAHKVGEFLKQKHDGIHSRTTIVSDIVLGLTSLMAGVVSVFVEEEVPRENDKKKTGFSAIVQGIKHHPLAAASGLLMVATVGHGISTVSDWKNVKKTLDCNTAATIDKETLGAFVKLRKALPWRATFVATNVAAEAAMAVSSKGHGAGVKSDDSLERSAYAVGADLVQRTPLEKRDAVLAKISKFYAHKKHLANDPEAIAQGIRKELADIGSNPWAGLTYSNKATEIQQQPSREEPRWQEKFTKPTKIPATAPLFKAETPTPAVSR